MFHHLNQFVHGTFDSVRSPDESSEVFHLNHETFESNGIEVKSIYNIAKNKFNSANKCYGSS